MRSSESGPPPSVDRDAWFGFLTVHSRVTRELDAQLSAEHGMPLVEFEVLLKLSIAGGRLRMSELAEVALMSRSGLTRIVHELEAQGLVRREEDADDGRVVHATITAPGKRRLAKVRASHLENVRRLFLEPLDDGQRAGLAAAWAAIEANLDGQDATPRPRRLRARHVPSRA